MDVSPPMPPPTPHSGPTPEAHPLQSPKSAAALAVVGFWGVGIGLIVTNSSLILGLTGLAMTFGAWGMIAWIYWRDFEGIYRLVRTHVRPTGFNRADVILGLGFIAATLLIPLLLIYQQATAEAPYVPPSRVDYVGFDPQPASPGMLADNGKPLWLITIKRKNNGVVAAVPLDFTGATSLPDKMMSANETEETMSKVDRQIEAQTRKLTPSTNEVQPGMENDITIGAGATDDQRQKFAEGKQTVYFMFATSYTDRTLKHGEFFVSEFCAFFETSFNKWNYCPNHNRVYRTR